jgi:hypothetical protein
VLNSLASGGAAVQVDLNRKSGIVINGAASLLFAGSQVVSNCVAGDPATDGGAVVHGSLDSNALLVDSNSCDGVVVEMGADTSKTILLGATVTNNQADGVRVLSAPFHVGGDFTDDVAVSQWGVLINNASVHNNNVSAGAAGIEAGTASSGAQSGDIYLFVENSSVFNNKQGVVAVGDPAAENFTAITLGNNTIDQNLGSGLSITQAFIKVDALTANAAFVGYGIYTNTIAHNGFAATDTTCTSETAAQIVFSGPAPIPTDKPSTLCSGKDPAQCTAVPSDFCVFVDSVGCRRAYPLQAAAVCPTSASNLIFGYEGSTSPQVIGPTKVGVYAQLGAIVNGDGNRWKTSSPGGGTDFTQDAGSGSNVLVTDHCPSAGNSCPARH